MNYQVCTRCVMDTSVPGIEFFADGRCSCCKHYDEVLTKDVFEGEDAERRLESLVSEIKRKGRGREYDCLIGLSGGVDSSYVAYLVRKRFGLRTVAVHVDNGWNTELAVANVERLVKKLEIDLVTQVLDWNEFRDIQASFLKSGISNIEIPTDHAIWAVLIKTAARLRVPYIIAGNNVVTESVMPESWLYGSKDSRLIRAIHREYGTRPMRAYPYLTTLDFVRYLLLGGIRWVPLLNYVPYVKSEAKRLLIEELEWRDYGGKHYESIFTRFFHAFYLPSKFGFDLRRAYCSAMVCSGQITREEALEELATPPAPAEMLNRDREYVVKKLGISEEEFDKILRAQNRTFSDYPNNDDLWRRFSGIVRWARSRITRVG